MHIFTLFTKCPPIHPSQVTQWFDDIHSYFRMAKVTESGVERLGVLLWVFLLFFHWAWYLLDIWLEWWERKTYGFKIKHALNIKCATISMDPWCAGSIHLKFIVVNLISLIFGLSQSDEETRKRIRRRKRAERKSFKWKKKEEEQHEIQR